MVERWKLTIQFDGSEFYGWQRQNRERTIQGELETALSTFVRQPVCVMGQGRTDRGVHATGQVAHTDLPPGIDKNHLLAAMRGLLPGDMAVTEAAGVADNFHARFDAKSRVYSYYVSAMPSPLYRHMCWVCLEKPDIKHLRECARLACGEHDFRNFAKEPKNKQNQYKTTICTIDQSFWQSDGHRLIYSIEGNRFLRHMVRRLVGSMFRVALGKLEVEDFRTLLKGNKVQHKGHAAPARGLILEKVHY